MWFYSFFPYIPTTRGKSLNSSTTTTTTKVKVQQKRKPVLHLEADDVGLEDFGEVIWDGGVAGARILESGVQTIHIPAHNPHCDALSLSPRPSLQFQWTLLSSPLLYALLCSSLSCLCASLFQVAWNCESIRNLHRCLASEVAGASTSNDESRLYMGMYV